MIPTGASSNINRHNRVVSPLTGDRDVELLESIEVADLRALYSNYFGVEVSKEFSGVESIGLYRCLKSGLGFFHPAVTGSESFYEILQRQPWYYLESKAEYDFARGFISHADSVLEVGCGRGEFAKKIVAKRYVGLELSRRARELAAADGIPVITQPVEKHSLEHEQHYEVVCAFQVLEHVTNPTAFIGACNRCLKPGGLLIYSVPNADTYLLYDTNCVLNMPPHHNTWWREATFRYIASSFGMDIHAVEHERLADIHVGQYATILTREVLLRWLGMKKRRRIVNRSLSFKVMNRLAILLSKPFAKVLLEDSHLRPIGHSLTVVLRKPVV
jgi:SAM-dependent methyltransferase